MDLKTVIQTINQIAEEKGIDPTRVTEAIENSLAAAYRREYLDRGANVKAKLNKKTGEVHFFKAREVVDETTVRMTDEEPASDTEEEENKLPRYNPERHILLDEARQEKKDAQLGEELEFSLPSQIEFGRIAAQNAKQVILQSLREAERESVANEFKDKEGKIVSGVVQRFERGNVYIDLGRTTGVMFANESIPGEHYRVGERLRFYVVAVQREIRGPGTGVVLSRSHPDFVSELFAMEIPEIADGVVEIKTVVREPGSRTKIAVASNAEEIDPVGSCVGQRGTRIMAISNELGQEKIDVVEWSEDTEEFIANSLSPAKVRSVEIAGGREAKVLVTDDQLSLAIGRGGQNVRLAAKLTGWKIDVRSQARPNERLEGGVADAEVRSVAQDEAEDGEEPVKPDVSDQEKPAKEKPVPKGDKKSGSKKTKD
ncbi:MAG: transcription termination factor NusA [Candidatus Colwellbacteria bacterium RBG_13_48_8]|uniref:Transcription termination/antitermination protein NusA n=1 Tax=Candidatus Colwellbacteria bacterium RBG_13_48_8 TaxID=1797685 RepID=A0A1G1YWC8_9BACT|nr:MAG: transcription termination factor NusA [Candidatus Colwellbacteria bacterium RBG_13_48_8]